MKNAIDVLKNICKAPYFQLDIAKRLCRKIHFPNLLCDPSVAWDVTVDAVLRRTSQLSAFKVEDEAVIQGLGLLVVPSGEGHHLIVPGSGVYSFNRADVGLTATRELELCPVRWNFFLLLHNFVWCPTSILKMIFSILRDEIVLQGQYSEFRGVQPPRELCAC